MAKKLDIRFWMLDARKNQAVGVVKKYGVLFGVSLIVLLISLSLFLPKNQFQRAKERLARNPNDFEAHLMLAEEYLKNNQLEEAERELLLAQKNYDSGSHVLGEEVSLNLKELWVRWREEKPEELEKLIAEWERVISERPNYRDGYLRLALFHYKLHENEKANGYLQKALELDPNFEPARELEKVLGD